MAIDWMFAPFQTTFLGTSMRQLWPDFLMWERFFQSHSVASMIEIGTGSGGLSLYFYLQAQQRRFVFWTYDIKQPEVIATVLGEGMKRCFVQEDVFNSPSFHGLVTVAPRPLMLFCDGGHKSREIQTFGPLLKTGDFVAVHDWPGEISEKDVEPLKDILKPLWHKEAEELKSWTRFWAI